MTISKKGSKRLSCKKGEIKRDAYTTKNGTKVKASCIKATSQSGKKESLKVKAYLKEKEKIHTDAKKKFPNAPKKCSKGKILRDGFKPLKI